MQLKNTLSVNSQMIQSFLLRNATREHPLCELTNDPEFSFKKNHLYPQGIQGPQLEHARLHSVSSHFL